MLDQCIHCTRSLVLLLEGSCNCTWTCEKNGFYQWWLLRLSLLLSFSFFGLLLPSCSKPQIFALAPETNYIKTWVSCQSCTPHSLPFSILYQQSVDCVKTTSEKKNTHIWVVIAVLVVLVFHDLAVLRTVKQWDHTLPKRQLLVTHCCTIKLGFLSQRDEGKQEVLQNALCCSWQSGQID